MIALAVQRGKVPIESPLLILKISRIKPTPLVRQPLPSLKDSSMNYGYPFQAQNQFHSAATHNPNIAKGHHGHSQTPFNQFASTPELSSLLHLLMPAIHNISCSVSHQAPVSHAQPSLAQEYQTLNGMYNNPLYPGIGSVGQAYPRLAAPDYNRGIDAAHLPSAREVSNAINQQVEPRYNTQGLSDLFWMWGQFIDHDMTHTPSSSNNPRPIPVPIGDPHFDPQHQGNASIPFNASETQLDANGHRVIANDITSFIDGNTLYGQSLEDQANLRSYEGGKLILDQQGLLPLDEQGNFIAGEARVNEHAGLTALHTLWAREHNRIADALGTSNPLMNDEEVFQESRRRVVAEIQAVTYNEYLPSLLGQYTPLPYTGYNPTVDPSISAEFATAAYRFGHTMLSPNLHTIDENGEAGDVALDQAFNNPQLIKDHGIDDFLRGGAAQLAQKLDPLVIDEVRNLLFGPPGAGGMDLAALNIQRGRDHNLPSYNGMREAIGLAAIEDFDHPIFGEYGEQLAQVYDDTNDIDLWVGGLAEQQLGNSTLGETFTWIVSDQFRRTRDGDRFWYQNQFQGAELLQLETLSLVDVIRANTSINLIQPHVLQVPY